MAMLIPAMEEMASLKGYERELDLKVIALVNKMYEHLNKNTANGCEFSLSIMHATKLAVKHLVRHLDASGISLRDLDRVSFINFVDYFIMIDSVQPTTKSMYMKVIKKFIRFLIEKNVVRNFDIGTSRFNGIIVKNARSKIRMIPSYNDIIAIRQLPILIDTAILIEFLLSSGLRISEALQVRYCDIKIGDVPYDVKSGQKTIYAGASITVDPVVHVVKTRTGRITYISKLAMKLLRIYMKVNGVDSFDSKAPIFPWKRRTIQGWLMKIQSLIDFETVIGLKSVEMNLLDEYNVTQEDLQKLNPAIREAVERRVAEKIANITSMPKPKDVFSDSLTAHSMRHAFACVQMYRDFRGGRGDLAYVRSLLGHGTDLEIFTYIKKLCLIRTDGEWVNIQCGTPLCWANMKLKKTHPGYAGTAVKKKRLIEEKLASEDEEEGAVDYV